MTIFRPSPMTINAALVSHPLPTHLAPANNTTHFKPGQAGAQQVANGTDFYVDSPELPLARAVGAEHLDFYNTTDDGKNGKNRPLNPAAPRAPVPVRRVPVANLGGVKTPPATPAIWSSSAVQETSDGRVSLTQALDPDELNRLLRNIGETIDLDVSTGVYIISEASQGGPRLMVYGSKVELTRQGQTIPVGAGKQISPGDSLKLTKPDGGHLMMVIIPWGWGKEPLPSGDASASATRLVPALPPSPAPRAAAAQPKADASASGGSAATPAPRAPVPQHIPAPRAVPVLRAPLHVPTPRVTPRVLPPGAASPDQTRFFALPPPSHTGLLVAPRTDQRPGFWSRLKKAIAAWWDRLFLTEDYQRVLDDEGEGTPAHDPYRMHTYTPAQRPSPVVSNPRPTRLRDDPRPDSLKSQPLTLEAVAAIFKTEREVRGNETALHVLNRDADLVQVIEVSSADRGNIFTIANWCDASMRGTNLAGFVLKDKETGNVLYRGNRK